MEQESAQEEVSQLRFALAKAEEAMKQMSDDLQSERAADEAIPAHGEQSTTAIQASSDRPTSSMAFVHRSRS